MKKNSSRNFCPKLHLNPWLPGLSPFTLPPDQGGNTELIELKVNGSEIWWCNEIIHAIVNRLEDSTRCHFINIPLQFYLSLPLPLSLFVSFFFFLWSMKWKQAQHFLGSSPEWDIGTVYYRTEDLTFFLSFLCSFFLPLLHMLSAISLDYCRDNYVECIWTCKIQHVTYDNYGSFIEKESEKQKKTYSRDFCLKLELNPWLSAQSP